MSALASSVLEKSEALNKHAMELEALRGRLQMEQRRSAEATRKLEEMQRAGGVDDVGALEAGGGSSFFRGRRRRPESIAKLELIARYEQLARAADWLDKFATDGARFLRNEPGARLAFICYVLLLHFWAVFVFVFHSHHTHVSHSNHRGVPAVAAAALHHPPPDPANMHLHMDGGRR